MADAQLEFTTATITATSDGTKADFRASGKKILFPGFFRAYVEGRDNPAAALEDQEIFLPELAEQDETELRELATSGHETKAPGRFTGATLVAAPETRGLRT